MSSALLLAILAVASSRPATQGFGEFTVGAGTGFSNGRRIDHAFHASGAVVGVLPIGEALAVALRLRGMVFPFDPIQRAGQAYDLVVGLHLETQTPVFVRALAGGGIGSPCLSGDFCGWVGPAGALQIGLTARLTDAVRLVASADVTVQFGVANIAGGVLVLPSLSTGLRF